MLTTFEAIGQVPLRPL